MSDNFFSSLQQESLSVLVLRLFPFLRHNIASVRKSALQTLNTLLQHSNAKVRVLNWHVNRTGGSQFPVNLQIIACNIHRSEIFSY